MPEMPDETRLTEAELSAIVALHRTGANGQCIRCRMWSPCDAEMAAREALALMAGVAELRAALLAFEWQGWPCDGCGASFDNPDDDDGVDGHFPHEQDCPYAIRNALLARLAAQEQAREALALMADLAAGNGRSEWRGHNTEGQQP